MDFYTLLVVFLSFMLLSLPLFRPWKSRLPPGPFPLPIVGNLFNLTSEFHKSLAQLSSVYGPLMTLKLGSITTVVASSPKMAKEVLQINDQVLSNRTIPDALRALDHHKNSMIWLPTSTQWRNIRKFCSTQLFITPKLNSSQGLRLQKIQELLAYIEEKRKSAGAIDIGQLAFSTILNLLSNTVFSKDLTRMETGYGQEFKDLIGRLSTESGRPNLSDYFPILRPLDIQSIKRKVEAIFKKFDDLFDELIKERLKSRESGVMSTSNDFLDTILDYRHEDGSQLSDAEIKTMLKDIFVAGTDTTTNTIEWAMAELLRWPNKMAKAKEELTEKIGKGNSIDESSIDSLSYLEAVVKETFRLHPPAPYLIPHKAETDVEINGFIVPKNAQVLVNLWAIGRDPKVWEDPLSFKPERFLDASMEHSGRNFELIPFGAGRRMCPGIPLAYRIVYMMLASLLHAFDWKLEEGVKPDDMDMEERPGITLQKNSAVMAVPFKT